MEPENVGCFYDCSSMDNYNECPKTDGIRNRDKLYEVEAAVKFIDSTIIIVRPNMDRVLVAIFCRNCIRYILAQ